MRCYFDKDGPEARAWAPKFKGNVDHLPLKTAAYKRALGLVEAVAEDRLPDESVLDAKVEAGAEAEGKEEEKVSDGGAKTRAMPRFARKASRHAMEYHKHAVGGAGAAHDHPDLSAPDRAAVGLLLKHAPHHAGDSDDGGGEGKEADDGDGVDGIAAGVSALSVAAEGKEGEGGAAANGAPAAAGAEPPAAPSGAGD